METVNTFKWRLDKFWSDQDVLYNYKADLHGIGNRSTIAVCLKNEIHKVHEIHSNATSAKYRNPHQWFVLL